MLKAYEQKNSHQALKFIALVAPTFYKYTVTLKYINNS